MQLDGEPRARRRAPKSAKGLFCSAEREALTLPLCEKGSSGEASGQSPGPGSGVAALAPVCTSTARWGPAWRLCRLSERPGGRPKLGKGRKPAEPSGWRWPRASSGPFCSLGDWGGGLLPGSILVQAAWDWREHASSCIPNQTDGDKNQAAQQQPTRRPLRHMKLD